MNIKKSFPIFCILKDSEIVTLEKKYTHEQLERFLNKKLDSFISIECDHIEMDESLNNTTAEEAG